MSEPDDDFDTFTDRTMARAVAAGDLATVERLVRSRAVDPLQVGRDATNWLVIAVAMKQRPALDLLLALGALGDPAGPVAGEALYTATLCDDPSWLERLHAAGADLNNRGGGDLLLAAAMNTYNEATLDFYLTRGADLDRPTGVGGTVALSAAVGHRFDLAHRFLDLGASPWAVDATGVTLGSAAEQAGAVPAWGHGSAADRDRLRLLARLHTLGFPNPAPTPAAALKLKQAGDWPPRDSAAAR